MKRHLTIVLLASLLFASVHAQAQVNTGGVVSLEAEQMHVLSGQWNKRWQISTFGSLSLNNSWFNRGSFATLAMPVGMQLTHQLNKNWYAFGRLSAVPAFLNFNSAFSNPGFNKTYPGNGFFNSNNFDIYPRAEAGFFYINDQKTFSVSGSMFVDRGNYLIYPPFRTNNHPARPVNGLF